jgi:hypothetical protein
VLETPDGSSLSMPPARSEPNTRTARTSSPLRRRARPAALVRLIGEAEDNVFLGGAPAEDDAGRDVDALSALGGSWRL